MLCAPPAPVTAQAVTVTGQIRHGGEHNRPLPGLWAVLHEVRRDTAASGPVDSVRTDRAGRYRLTLPRADTTAIYFVSTSYQTVGYFSGGVRVEGRTRADVDPVVVYDTTAVGPMRLARRLFAIKNGERGARSVLELVEIENPSLRTRVALDSVTPVWTTILPPGATGWEAGEGDLSPEALVLTGDTVQVYAPIWPGEPRQMSYSYTLTGSTLRIPVDQPTAELDLLLEDTAAAPAGAAFETLGTYEIDGRSFAAHRAGPVDAGTEIRVTLPGTPLRPEQFVPYIAVLAGLALGWGLWVALKRKPLAVSR